MTALEFHRSAFGSQRDAHVAIRFGMVLFLASLAVLFLSTLIGYVIIQVQLRGRGTWPESIPRLPLGLVLSTVVLAVSSWTLESGVRVASAPADARDPRRIRAAFDQTALLGTLFLLMQGVCWWVWLRDVGAEAWARSTDHRFALMGFYVLTGLHALHVVGGLVPLVGCAWLVRRPDGATDRFATTARFTAVYWHFLGVVWLLLYALLLVTTW